MPTNYVTLDANSTYPFSISYAIRKRKEFFTYLQSSYKGPLSGEGAFGFSRSISTFILLNSLIRLDAYYAGYVAGVESEIEGGAGSMTLPEYVLRQVMPLQANQGSFGLFQY